MYGSHLSYTNDAMLGADECDLLVDLVRARESAGLYGAKITGGGSGRDRRRPWPKGQIAPTPPPPRS
jgi:hypothetical protein